MLVKVVCSTDYKVVDLPERTRKLKKFKLAAYFFFIH